MDAFAGFMASTAALSGVAILFVGTISPFEWLLTSHIVAATTSVALVVFADATVPQLVQPLLEVFEVGHQGSGSSSSLFISPFSETDSFMLGRKWALLFLAITMLVFSCSVSSVLPYLVLDFFSWVKLGKLPIYSLSLWGGVVGPSVCRRILAR